MVKKFEFCQPRFERTPILIILNFVKFYLSFVFTLASKVKKFEFCRADLAGKPIESPPIFLSLVNLNIYLFRKFCPSCSNGSKVQKCGRPDSKESPKVFDFCRKKVLLDIFNCSKFECSAFSGLNVDSGRRKKKRKIKQDRKNMQNKKKWFSCWVKRT